VEADPVIWTARLRIDRVAILQASASRTFSAAALIGLAVEASAAEAGSAVIASAAGAALIDLVAEVAVAEGSGGVDEDNAWNFPIFFLEKLKPQTNH
jgi:hypothetical protein